MAVEGSGPSENVFIQPPRVSFGELPVSSSSASTSSSLLTFADMVLSLDRETVLENVKSPKLSNRVLSLDLNLDSDGSRVTDHTYASCRSLRATRSQTAKAVQLSAMTTFTEQGAELNSDTDSDPDVDLHSSCDIDQDLKESILDCQHSKMKSSQLHLLSQTPPSAEIEPFCAHNYCAKSKRCSSEENISADTLHSKRADCNNEWPPSQTKLEKHSRKSCSFEEVDKKSRMKSSKSSESVQRGSVPQTLHRFVNNTLEFPCWPRKADHTYATATWDGTAASHSLFEGDQDSHLEISGTSMEHQPMEEDSLSFLQNQDYKHVKLDPYPSQFNIQQKEDHTYVKHAFSSDDMSSFATESLTIKGGSTEKSSTNLNESYCSMDSTPSTFETHSTWPRRFSSATFPRLKNREDHTYFHSGLSGSSGSSTGGRDWVSTQTVASPELSQDMQIEETYRSLHSFSQSASAKKDHNYSTSA